MTLNSAKLDTDAPNAQLLNRVRALLHMWWDWEASRERITSGTSSVMFRALSDERAEVLRQIHAELIRQARQP